MKTCRGYITSTPFAGERVPQHIQNIVIRDYSIKNNINLLMSNTEYCMKDSQLILNQSIKELNILDGIILYSLFQLPKSDAERSSIYSKVITTNKILYFAVESISAKSEHDFSLIEDIWKIKKTLANCFNPKSINELGEY
jgi:sporadic carbohydrate cluster protein (TIGR04323 family)